MKTTLYIKMLIAFLVTVLMAAAAGTVFAGEASRVRQQQFFESLHDVPLMPGLYEMLEESMVFDKPGGRIAESAAASDSLAGEEIRAFYNSALPQMGWTGAADGSFVREGEALRMRVEQRNGYNIVHFTVSPRPDGSR